MLYCISLSNDLALSLASSCYWRLVSLQTCDETDLVMGCCIKASPKYMTGGDDDGHDGGVDDDDDDDGLQFAMSFA